MVSAYQEGKFLADPEARGKPRPNPMSDPAAMEGMMGMMKGNVAMMVPQSLIMGWINAFFSGYVISMWSSQACRTRLHLANQAQ
jgi:ER membrane protein complex subunit 3